MGIVPLYDYVVTLRLCKSDSWFWCQTAKLVIAEMNVSENHISHKPCVMAWLPETIGVKYVQI